jgi:beta-1,4-N-acetylglucosaminyltransferase
MILVTVGTHSEGFNRLVQAADDYAALTGERVVIQRGVSSFVPRYAESFEFTEFDRMKQLNEEARVVVMHAAAGAILLGLQLGKPLVLVPRRKMYREHYDDHQLELTDALCRSGQSVECNPVSADGLDAAVDAAAAQTRTPAGPDRLIENLRQHLDGLARTREGM